MTTTNVVLDSRSRITLGNFAKSSTYVMDVTEDGVVTLSPAEVLTRDEIKALSRPDVLAAIEASRAAELNGQPSAPAPVRKRLA